MSATVGVTADACKYAFQLGQRFERLVIDRGVELAKQTGNPNVTMEQIKAALTPEIFTELMNSLEESLNDAPEGKRGDKRKSWEAA